MAQIRNQEGQLDPDAMRLFDTVIEGVTACSCSKAQRVMLHILKDEHFFGFVYLHDAIEFAFVIVFVGVEIGSESDFIEEEIDRKRRQGLLGDVLLKQRLQKWPEDHFLDDAVDGACLLLVFEEAHLASIHAQSQLSRVQHSDPTKIITPHVIFDNQVQTFLSLHSKVQHLRGWAILIVIKIEIEDRLE